MTKRSKKAKSGFTEVDLIPLIARASVEERRIPSPWIWF